MLLVILSALCIFGICQLCLAIPLQHPMLGCQMLHNQDCHAHFPLLRSKEAWLAETLTVKSALPGE